MVIVVNPNPTANISGDNQICSGDNVTLNATGGSGYVWSNGGGTNPTATFNNVTSTNIQRSYRCANGCTDDATFTVN
ncbi:MAG: hypothetical protein IPG48_05125 [Saprospiraceae bacterium]|nr:hypothetical protein [Saprospiraceae bacterium]